MSEMRIPHHSVVGPLQNGLQMRTSVNTPFLTVCKPYLRLQLCADARSTSPYVRMKSVVMATAESVLHRFSYSRNKFHLLLIKFTKTISSNT